MDHRQSESCPKTSNDCDQINQSSDEDVQESDLDESYGFRNISLENQHNIHGEPGQRTSQLAKDNANISNIIAENEISSHLEPDSRLNSLQPGNPPVAGNSDCLVGAPSFVSDDKGHPHRIESNNFGSEVDYRESGISNTNKINDIHCEDGVILPSVNENLAVAGPSGRKSRVAEARRKPYDRPFVCKVCGKDFNDRWHLDRHYLTHTGEKPYECDFCGKGFIQSSDLANHQRTHTGEKPFVCETCGKRYRTSSDLSRHRKTHK